MRDAFKFGDGLECVHVCMSEGVAWKEKDYCRLEDMEI